MTHVAAPLSRLLIADDHTLFRDALTSYIVRARPDLHVTTVDDLHQAKKVLAQGQNFHLALLDWHMPGVTGLLDITNLVTVYPRIRFAIMSGVIDITAAERSLAEGLWGYFPKTLSGRAMVDGLAQVLAGEKFVPRKPGSGDLLPSHYGETLFYQGNGAGDNQTALLSAVQASLTLRELEALKFLTQGLTNAEIADKMQVKEVTIKLHLSNAFDKIGARNRTEAALKCQQMGLFQHG